MSRKNLINNNKQKLDKMQYLRKVSIDNMKAQGLNGDTDLAANKL